MNIVSSKSSSQCSEKKTDTHHVWITVVNPTNHRLLLQACDDCGVVKSQNSVLKQCRAVKGRALVSGRMSLGKNLVI